MATCFLLRRRDHTLQSIVYKMAPNLARAELQRRRKFRRCHGLQGECLSSVILCRKVPTQLMTDVMCHADGDSTDDRFLQSFFADSDPISLSLQYAHP